MGERIRESHPAGAWVWNCMPLPGASSVQTAGLLALSLQIDFQRGLRGDRSHALLAPVRVGIVIGLGVAVLFGSSAVTVLRDSLPSAMMPTALMTSLAGTRPRAISCATHELRCLHRWVDSGAGDITVSMAWQGGDLRSRATTGASGARTLLEGRRSDFQVHYPTAGGTG